MKLLLMTKMVVVDLHLQLLMNGQFFETDSTNWDRRCAKASLSYSILRKRIADLEQEPELPQELKESLSVSGASIEVQLVIWCKSHKPSGAVVLHFMLLTVSQCGLQINTESSWNSFRLFTVTPPTSSETFHPWKLCLNIILCVRALRNSSWVVILRSWHAMQLRVRENDYFSRLTVSFPLISSRPRRVIFRGHGEYKKGSRMRMKNSEEMSDAVFAFLVERWCLRPDTNTSQVSGSQSVDRLFPFCHRSRVQANQFEGNHWERTVLTLLTALHRDLLRASQCLERCQEHLPSSRKPNKNLSTS